MSLLYLVLSFVLCLHPAVMNWQSLSLLSKRTSAEKAQLVTGFSVQRTFPRGSSSWLWSWLHPTLNLIAWPPAKAVHLLPWGDPHGEGPGNHLPGKLFPFIENLTTKRENLILVISTWRGNKSAYTHTHTKKIPVCVCTHTNMLATKNTGVLSSWTALFCLEYF